MELMEKNLLQLREETLAALRKASPAEVLDAYTSLAAKGFSRDLVETAKWVFINEYLRQVLHDRPHVDTSGVRAVHGRETIGDIRSCLLTCATMTHRLALLHQDHPLVDELRDIEKQLDIIRGRLYKIQ